MTDGQRTLLIVADVDGTLLDGTGRLPCTPGALRERLDGLARAHAAVCSLALASSRTLAELVVLQRGMRITGACIAEDGAMLAIDADAAGATGVPGAPPVQWRAGRRTLSVWRLGDSADRLRTELSGVIAPYELDPTDTEAMATLGFRSRAAVRRALVERRASVLLDLRGVDERIMGDLRDATGAAHAHLHRGGRWHTLTRGAGKGVATTMLRDVMTAGGSGPVRIVGVGNEENDVTLLASADLGFAIRNATGGVHPKLAAVEGAVPLTAEGTAGFVEMLDRLANMTLFEVVPS